MVLWVPIMSWNLEKIKQVDATSNPEGYRVEQNKLLDDVETIIVVLRKPHPIVPHVKIIKI